MGVLTFTSVLSLKSSEQISSLIPHRRKSKKKTHVFVPEARLFGPAIFDASKLEVVYLGVDEKKHPGKVPRTYTLTHSDITSKLTLAISQTINNSQLQGWYNWLQRDEVVGEWKKVKGKMSLHVHCHISGGHFLLDLCANLRFYIFRKELPVVLNAFVHGDMDLFNSYSELQEALVWVYFHSKIPKFNRLECWGPLKDRCPPSTGLIGPKSEENENGQAHVSWAVKGLDWPKPCQEDCNCCFPTITSIQWSPHLQSTSVRRRFGSFDLAKLSLIN